MAVEDGMVIGELLGKLHRDFSGTDTIARIAAVLKLYESLRKPRTTLNVKGAVANRELYHMPDGPEQVERDKELRATTWDRPTKYNWTDYDYRQSLLGFDVIKDCHGQYDVWRAEAKL